MSCLYNLNHRKRATQTFFVGETIDDYPVDEFGYPLSLKCLVTNTAACKFYEASGWKNAGLSGGTDGDAILYRLQLLAD